MILQRLHKRGLNSIHGILNGFSLFHKNLLHGETTTAAMVLYDWESRIENYSVFVFVEYLNKSQKSLDFLFFRPSIHRDDPNRWMVIDKNEICYKPDRLECLYKCSMENGQLKSFLGDSKILSRCNNTLKYSAKYGYTQKLPYCMYLRSDQILAAPYDLRSFVFPIWRNDV